MKAKDTDMYRELLDLHVKEFKRHEYCDCNFTREFTKSNFKNLRNGENVSGIVAFFGRLSRFFHSRWSLECILFSLWNIYFNGELTETLIIPPTRPCPFYHVYLKMSSVEAIGNYSHSLSLQCPLKILWSSSGSFFQWFKLYDLMT